MTDQQDSDHGPAPALADAIRGVRARYDKLPRGQTAALRRCRTAGDVLLEGVYWRIGDAVAQKHSGLGHVVLLFPCVPHASRARFSFGRYLRHALGDSDGAVLRFRRLIDSRDRDDLDHRLRRVLVLAARDGGPVDWGVLGQDILWWFAPSDRVRRRWAQDFYAPYSAELHRSSTSSTTTKSAAGAEVST